MAKPQTSTNPTPHVPARPRRPTDAEAIELVSAIFGDPKNRPSKEVLSALAESLSEPELKSVFEQRGNADEMDYFRTLGVKASTHVIVAKSHRCLAKNEQGVPTPTLFHPLDDNGKPVAILRDRLDAKTLEFGLNAGHIREPGKPVQAQAAA